MGTTIIEELVLRHLYLEEKKTDAEIGLMLGVRKTSVYKARKRYGINSIPRYSRKDCSLTQRQIEILYGSLLGDAAISNGNHGLKESVAEFKQGAKQKDYLFWKHSEFENVASSEPRQLSGGQWRFRTAAHPTWSATRELWYPSGEKRIPTQALPLLSPLSIAVWFMDDGRNCNAGLWFDIATCSFTDEEHDLLIDWLKTKYSIRAKKAVYNGYNHLVIERESRVDWINLVQPHIIPSMMYKIEARRLHNVVSQGTQRVSWGSN